MLYQVGLVVANENGTILMNLLGGYFSTNNSNLSKKTELTFYWLDIYWLSSSSKYTDCNCNDWTSDLKLFTLSLYSPCKAVKILRDSKNVLKFTNNEIQILHKDTVNEYLTHLTFLFSSIRTGVKNHYQTTIFIIIKLGVVQNHCFQFNLITVRNLQKQEDFLRGHSEEKIPCL